MGLQCLVISSPEEMENLPGMCYDPQHLTGPQKLGWGAATQHIFK